MSRCTRFSKCRAREKITQDIMFLVTTGKNLELRRFSKLFLHNVTLRCVNTAKHDRMRDRCVQQARLGGDVITYSSALSCTRLMSLPRLQMTQ